MFFITEHPIKTMDLTAQLARPQVGAVVSFEGRVRDHNEGKMVSALTYEVYAELALKEGRRIIEEATQRFQILEALAMHRYGRLDLEDIAVSVIVTSSHRDAAFSACRYIIDELKHRVPIWKQEHYKSGQHEWIGCETCRQSAELHHKYSPLPVESLPLGSE